MARALPYDNNAAVFFGLTLLTFYLIPALYYIFRRLTSKPVNAANVKVRSRAERQLVDLRAAEAAKANETWNPSFRIFVIATTVATFLFAVLVVMALHTPVLAKWDPWQILGITQSVTEREIRRAFRDRSLEHHPDRGGDPEVFADIAKAYETLTDPVKLENYRLYNNPDGRKNMELSIGLPTWLSEGFGATAFLGLYMFGLLIVVPVLMYRGYYRNKGKDLSTGLQNTTLGWLAQVIRSGNLSAQQLPEYVAGCPEFATLARFDAADDQVIGQYAGALNKDGVFRHLMPKVRWLMDPNTVLRNAVLLFTHLNRTKPSLASAFTTPALTDGTTQMLKTLPKIIDVLFNFGLEMEQFAEMQYFRQPDAQRRQAALPYRFIDSALELAKFSQLVTQGLWLQDKDLQQVFSEAAIERMHDKSNKGGRKASTLRQFLDFPPAERPILALLSKEDREEVEAIIADLPDLKIDSKVEVVDFPDICEDDIITATFTLRHLNLPGGATAEPPKDDKTAPSSDIADVPPVHAIRFPLARTESWALYMVDEHFEVNKRQTQKRILKYLRVECKKAVQDVTFMFQAPRVAGNYKYKLYALSLDYIGLDVTTEIAFTVKPKEKPVNDAPAAPEEDLGDQMTLEDMLASLGRGNNTADSDLESEAEDEQAPGEGAADEEAGSDDEGVAASEGAPVKDVKPVAAKPVRAPEVDEHMPSIIAGGSKKKDKKASS